MSRNLFSNNLTIPRKSLLAKPPTSRPHTYTRTLTTTPVLQNPPLPGPKYQIHRVTFTAPSRERYHEGHNRYKNSWFSTTARAEAMTAAEQRPNASGLSPIESKNLPARHATEKEGPIITALKELYTVSPTDKSYAVYAEDAVFHDPVGLARGKSSIKAQFNALPSLFPRAEIGFFRILETPPAASKVHSDPARGVVPASESRKGSSENEETLLIDQMVDYYRKEDATATKPFKSLNSLVTIKYDPNTGLIRSHIEEWDHKPETEHASFWDSLNEGRKKLTAKLTEAMASQTPPTERAEH